LAKFSLSTDEKLYLANLLDSSLSEVFIFDATTFKFTYVNRGAVLNIGYEDQELTEMRAWDIKPLTKQEFIEMIEPLVNGGQPCIEFQTKHIRKDQSEYDVQVRLERGLFGKRECFFANILDITVRTNLVSDLVRSSRLASTGELALSIGHEINNPLMVVDLHTRKLIKLTEKGNTFDPKEARVNLAKVLSASERICEITSNLRSFTLINEDDKKSLEINSIIKEATSFIGEILKKSEVNIELDLCEEELWSICSPGGLQQVIINLIMNAKDALLDKKGQRVIRIKTGLNNGQIKIIVADNGPGIDHKIIENIFDSFVTTKQNSGGTGLGLSISKHSINSFGGKIKAKNREAGGACFFITLQPTAVDDKSEKTGVFILNSLLDKEKRIALIEDEKGIREVLSDHLGQEGHCVHSFSCVDDFLCALQESSFDVVVSDINMPKKSGLDLVRLLFSKQEKGPKPFLFITGGSKECLSPEFTQIVADHEIEVLLKPFMGSELIDAVGRLCQKNLSKVGDSLLPKSKKVS